MTNTSRSLRHAVRFTLAASAISAGAPLAYAQQAAPSAAAPPIAVQEVVVTGSRIQQAPNDVSISPVTSITSVDIQQTGLLRTEDLLNNLPQVIAENSSGQSISSNGTATVSLRGLGSWRTLVLINGRRMSPGAGLAVAASSSPDINQVPADLIERADVLTGGASAVYGADAVAGVVNFVLNTHFEGVRIDANYAFGNHKNDNGALLNDLAAKNDIIPKSSVNVGQTKDVSVIAGSNFADGKGNATVYFTYLNQAPVYGYQMDYAGCTLNTPGSNPTAAGKKLACGGSSSSATGRFLDLGLTPVPGAVPPKSTVTTLSDRTVDGKTGAYRQYSSAGDSYNYGALSFLQRQAERYTSGAFLNYDVNDSVNLYSETMFARNTSTASYGPSGLFAFGTPSVSCSNPLLTAGELAALCSPANIASNQRLFGGTGDRITLYAARRSVESGPRLDNYSSDAIREVLGTKGKLSDAWSYDVYGQVGITQAQDIQGNYLGAQQINNALDAVPNPPSAPGSTVGVVKGVPVGGAVCAITLAGYDPTCVPWNIWNPGGVTQQQLNYLRVGSSYSVRTTEYIVSGSVTGDFGKYGVKVPSAASGLILNVGAEYRQESYDFDPDYIFSHGFASGGNGAVQPVHGTFHVSEGFTELRLPLIDEKPGAYQLSLDAGYRYSKYTSGFNTNTYKFGIEWAPIQDIRLRGGYNRAVRAPSVGDLYSPATIGAGGTADPCWGASSDPVNPINGTVNGHSFAFCQNTGVTAAQFGHIIPNPAAQINTSTGGNIGLLPEIADTYTFGFVLQPQAITNFVMSVDYYSIKIKNTIESLSSNTVVNNCGLTGSAALCGLIHRGAGTGSLWFNNNDFVTATEINIGTISTKGIDLAAHYRLDIGAVGKLAFSLSGTKTQNWLTQPIPTGGSFDCTGFMGTTCGAPTPEWRHVMSMDWASPWAGLDLTLRWRYIGSVVTDRASNDPQLKQAYFPGTAHIPSYSYFDFSVAMPVTTNVNFRLGVNNIQDKQPPVVANGNYSDCPNSSCNDNTWVGTYDTLGRYIYMHLSAKF
jgi:iron complex outermembrane receptor protein